MPLLTTQQALIKQQRETIAKRAAETPIEEPSETAAYEDYYTASQANVTETQRRTQRDIDLMSSNVSLRRAQSNALLRVLPENTGGARMLYGKKTKRALGGVEPGYIEAMNTMLEGYSKGHETKLKGIDTREYAQAMSERPKALTYEDIGTALPTWVEKHKKVITRGEDRTNEVNTWLGNIPTVLADVNAEEFNTAASNYPTKLRSYTSQAELDRDVQAWIDKYKPVLQRSENVTNANLLVQGQNVTFTENAGVDPNAPIPFQDKPVGLSQKDYLAGFAKIPLMKRLDEYRKDSDNDNVPNALDCCPFDSTKHRNNLKILCGSRKNVPKTYPKNYFKPFNGRILQKAIVKDQLGKTLKGIGKFKYNVGKMSMFKKPIIRSKSKKLFFL